MHIITAFEFHFFYKDNDMKQISTVAEMQEEALAVLRAGKKHGLVPTMGNLHAGHLSLMQQARQNCEIVTASIFVNPIQFNDPNDFKTYPRTLEADLKLCEEAGVDFVFTPTKDELYYPNSDISVDPGHLANHLCGLSRGRGHFIGVCTVVSKLFNIVRPDVAYFGQKDAQQALIIQRMIRDLNFPINIAIVPIVRETDGLAKSSRNNLLTAENRAKAPLLYKALSTGAEMINAGESNALNVIAKMTEIINQSGGELDYLNITDTETLEDVDIIKDVVLIAGALKLGDVRIIDNVLAAPANPHGKNEAHHCGCGCHHA